MIGLGSNRLTVCRRGGMSVTQAGRGGMEWLGSRGPSWSTPYSAQATAALKAQFPTQWPTIKDYGFAHPEIVGYMNAYAPEDAKIAYSLVPTLNVYRTLNNTTSAFIKSPMIVTRDNLLSLKVEIESQYHNSTSLPSWASYGYDVPNLEFGYNGSSQFVIGQPNSSFSSSGRNDSQYAVKMMRYVGDYVNKVAELYDMDGTRIYSLSNTGAVSLTFYGYGYGLFQSIGSSGGGGNNNCKSKLKSAKFYLNGNLQYWLVPFIRNGVNGLLDMVTNGFYTSANSSTFTISETPAS